MEWLPNAAPEDIWPAQLGLPAPVWAPNWTVPGSSVALSYMIANCHPKTLLTGLVDEAFMMAPTVIMVWAWMLWLVWMLVSVGLVLSASRLTVQGGGVLAWTGSVASVEVVTRRIARRAVEGLSLLWRVMV